MSGSSGSGPPPGGVVRNSALSFVGAAPAHLAPAGSEESPDARDGQTERQMPAGLKALCDAYSKLYPDQPNPLQVTTKLKYWLGGHDPLDYISMYWNPGKPEENVPPHWHYVSFGLSDLHGDGRVHPPPSALPSSQPSGCGVELTFRLEESGAALWPALLLQALASYLLTTGNKFCPGDHISWHAPLDGGPSSRVKHLLVAEDPQLSPINTVHGTVSFIQMVGCTGRELRAAQRGSGFDVLKLIADDPSSGAGSWLVTRARRRRSARGLKARAPAPSPAAPADLAGVSARLRWVPQQNGERQASPGLSPRVEQQIKETLQRGLSTMSTDRTGPEGHTGMSTDSFEMSSIERALPQLPQLMQCSWRGEESIEYLDGVHLFLNAEGASLLPLAIDGRVLHGRHFTWRAGGDAVTVLSPAVAGAFCSSAHPYVCKGSWLQMLIPKELAQDMSVKMSNLSKLSQTDSESDSDGESASPPPTIPCTIEWPSYSLKISVVSDQELL